MDGRMAAPPINRLTGLMPIEAHPGSATFRVPATPWLATPAGFFGAGSMALAADAALASAIMTTQAAGWTLTTSDLSLNFLRPVCVRSGAIVARARIMYALTIARPGRSAGRRWPRPRPWTRDHALLSLGHGGPRWRSGSDGRPAACDGSGGAQRGSLPSSRARSRGTRRRLERAIRARGDPGHPER